MIEIIYSLVSATARILAPSWLQALQDLWNVKWKKIGINLSECCVSIIKSYILTSSYSLAISKILIWSIASSWMIILNGLQLICFQPCRCLHFFAFAAFYVLISYHFLVWIYQRRCTYPPVIFMTPYQNHLLIILTLFFKICGSKKEYE